MIVSCDDNEVITDIKIIGGCPGNTQGVAILCKGRTIDEIISKLEGIDCRGRNTSCPDQLSIALKELKKEKVSEGE